PEAVGDAQDVFERVGEVDVGENAVVAAGGEQTLTDGVALAAVGAVADDAHPGIPAARGPARLPVAQAFGGAVGAAVADEHGLPARPLLLQERGDGPEGVFQARA